ncbi:hypothetical protein DXG01_000151 [Tephrocybe rancida]|nr:hypothetical protein DXG01_000151 [Tephrocybe rancida]
MPKSAKKRKDKAADFTKAKLKLGKGKQLASNAIDTSFKARSIALPSQSIAHEKDGDTPTTKRKLTFDDLITHAKHYSASTRKDAIAGFRELLEANWSLLESSLTTLINACVRLIGDEDTSVRKALVGFFAWLLPRIPQGDIIPHSPLLLLFTTSAQTHIFPEIRIDAIRFLDLFLEHIPQAVITGWNEDNNGHGARVLEGYLGILNAGTKFGETDGTHYLTYLSSAAPTHLPPLSRPNEGNINCQCSVNPSRESALHLHEYPMIPWLTKFFHQSKLIVLYSLSTFLQACLSTFTGPSTSTSPELPTSLNTWFLVSSFATPGDYQSFEQLLQPSGLSTHRLQKWREIIDPEENEDEFPCPVESKADDDNFTLQKLADISNIFGSSEFDTSDDRDINLVAHLARTLQSTLIATFLDCAPTVFTPNGSPSETQVQLILAVGQIVRTLYGVILQTPAPLKLSGSASDDLSAMLGYMTPYFPFNPSGSRDVKVEQAFQDLNLIFCELTSLLVLTTNAEVSRLTRRGKARQINSSASANKLKNPLSIQTRRVSDYILQLLSGGSASGSQLGRALTPAAYVALLPAIWALLNNTTGSTQHRSTVSAILSATITHSIKTSSKSALKRLTIEFVAQLILLSTEPRYHGQFRLGSDPDDDAKVQEWVTHLPQPLWEFGASNLPASEIIIRFLVRGLQQKSRAVHTSATMTALQMKLIPFFTITHPVRGQLHGPYSKIPMTSPLRRLALDLVVTLLWAASTDSGDGLRTAVELAVADTKEREYWEQIQNITVK